jgi:acyl-CoA synthetase (AMP-forming)/AMP-acid ligase II
MMSKKIHNSPIIDLFLKFSHNIFVSDCNKSLTYLQSLQLINKFIDFFKSNQIIGKTVVIELPNSLEAHLIMLASVLTNHTILINPVHALIANQMYKNLNVDVVIRSKKLLINGVDDLEIISLSNLTPKIKVNESQFLGDLYLLTSGTTGQSKIFCIRHSELIDYGTTYLSYNRINDTDKLLNLVPFFHGFGLTRIFSVMATGGSYYVANPNELKNLSRIGNFTWTSLVPTLVEFFVKSVDRQQTSKSWKFATVSAEMCKSELIHQFQNKFNIPLLAEYGCTEASVISSNQIENNRPGSVGQISGNTVKIINSKIFVLPTWQKQASWIDTGDLGFFDADGYLNITGREKELIKKNGINVYPIDLENQICQITGVEQAVIYPIHTSSQTLIGLAYVGKINKIELANKLVQHINSFYQPDRIIQVTQIPQVGNKIRRLEMENYVSSL